MAHDKLQHCGKIRQESCRSETARTLPMGARAGSVLLMVLVVVAMLTLGTATYLELMQNERLAARHHGRSVQATRLAESGVEYIRTLLALTPDEILQTGGLANNPTSMQAIVVDDEGDEFDRGRFSIVSPAQADGYYTGYRFGLEDESSKLNVNALLAPGAEDEAANRLMSLPGMTVETADAILDWLDVDESPRTSGAEAETYSQLSPPYAPRNGPIADLDELLQVRGVTPELLYGVDQNRNFIVDSAELPRGVLLELDNADGQLNRGWSAYLTANSVEQMQPPTSSTAGSSSTATTSAASTLDLNGQNLQQLYTDLSTAIGDDKAKFLIVYRQYGPYQDQQSSGGANPAGRAGGANAAGGASSGGAAAGEGVASQGIQEVQDVQAIQDIGGISNNNNNGGGAQNPNQGGGGAQGQNGGQNQQPVEVAAAGLTLKFDQQGQTQINSPLDLVGIRVQIPGENNGPAQNVTSPFTEDAASYRELLKLYDAAPPAGTPRVAGRVNVNGASRVVLNSIPSLPDAAVGKIISRREAEPNPVLSEQRHPLWLLIEGIVTLDEMRQLERYITTGGDAFSGQAIGFFDAGPAAARQEFTVDRSGSSPQVRVQRDLTPLGRGFSTLSMGVEAGETTAAP